MFRYYFHLNCIKDFGALSLIPMIVSFVSLKKSIEKVLCLLEVVVVTSIITNTSVFLVTNVSYFILTEGCTQLLSITELYLNDTFLEFLPANFGRLSKLRILELRENGLNTLPKSLSRLTCLERLDLGQNEISELPEVIGSLTR